MDLIYNILIGKPQIRPTIIKTLEKYGDEGKQMAIIIKSFDPKRKNILKQFSNVNLYEERENYVSLPSNVRVSVVEKPRQLSILLNDLKKCEDSDFPYVGLDAEWSPYLSRSRYIPFHRLF